MAEYIWPSHIPVAEVEWRLIDLTGRFTGTLTPFVRTVSRGQLLACTYRLSNLSAADRAYVLGLVAALRGGANRIWIYDAANRQRGTFPGTELLSNASFEGGTTGWTSFSEYTLSVNQRVMRCKRNAVTLSQLPLQVSSAVTATLYQPHLARFILQQGRGSFASLSATAGTTLGASDYGSSLSSALGVRQLPVVAVGTSVYPGIIDGAASGLYAGDYFDVPYASFARCALVDGGINEATYSDQLENGAWSQQGLSALTANVHVAPDGTATMENVVENSGSGPHGAFRTLTRPAAGETWCVYGTFARHIGARDVRLYVGSDGSNYAQCIFDLGAGTAGTPAVVGTPSSARAYVRHDGNGRYTCFLLANLASSTSVLMGYDMSSAGTAFYTGNGTGAIGAWRVGAARSGVPVRPTQAVASAVPGAAQTGTGIYLKGLPASTNGLLLPGDGVEIQGERKLVTASLDSDAAGLGYLQFEPAMRVAAADNAPVIIGQPLMKAVLAEDASWVTRPGTFSDLTLSFIEAA